MSGVLSDKIAVITGAGGGIGKAFALRYAAEGAKLLLPEINLETAEATVELIRSHGGQASAIETDISDEKSVQKMSEEAVRLYGRVDILINNAALFAGINPAPWDSWSVESWDKYFAVNVRGTWLCCKAIVPLMVRQKSGKIINITSDSANLNASQYLLPYSSSKAAVSQITKSLARALGPSGINVNAIAPGLTATNASLVQENAEDQFAATLDIQYIKRREKPEDLVGTAVFLATADSDFITGQIFYVNGGAVIN